MLCVVICAELVCSMNALPCYTNLYSTQRKQEFRGGKEHVYLCLWVFMCVCVCEREKEKHADVGADSCYRCRPSHICSVGVVFTEQPLFSRGEGTRGGGGWVEKRSR